MSVTARSSGRTRVFPPGTARDEAVAECAPLGDSFYIANQSEWLATQLHKGDICWWKARNSDTWYQAAFSRSVFYDGIIARVYEIDPDDLIEHALLLDAGDELRLNRP